MTKNNETIIKEAKKLAKRALKLLISQVDSCVIDCWDDDSGMEFCIPESLGKTLGIAHDGSEADKIADKIIKMATADIKKIMKGIQVTDG
jgi:hypothetical protein